MLSDKVQGGLAVVIVSYNGESDLWRCLLSLRMELPLCNVIVVDNASTDGTVPMLQREFSDVALLPHRTNVGFGNANNIGIRRALANGRKHVLLLNQDTVVEPGCIETLLEVAENHPEYGVLSPLHLGSLHGHTLETDFARFAAACALLEDALAGTAQELYQVPFVNAACWLVSKECLRKVGGFSPCFFMYIEDEDFCTRVNYHGLRVGIVSSARIRHIRRGNDLIPGDMFSYRKRRIRVEHIMIASLLDPELSLIRKWWCLGVGAAAGLITGPVAHKTRMALADFAAFVAVTRRVRELAVIRRKNLSGTPFLWLE